MDIPVSRHFLSWNKPLPQQAARWLAEGWTGNGPLDLSDTWIVVATREAGRRLREALAAHASRAGQAVFSPRVLTPESLTAVDPGSEVASKLESLLAWTEVFQQADLSSCRAVFPVDPPVRNFPWAIRLAQEFSRLQFTLATAGLRMADVGDRAGPNFVEAERWAQLAQLESQHASGLGRRGLRAPAAARLETARAAPPDVVPGRLVVLGCPDLPPLAETALRRLSGGKPIVVAIYGAADDDGAYDRWGRPRPTVWEKRIHEIEDVGATVHLCGDPSAQAGWLAQAASRYLQPGMLALGIADPEVLPPLANELARLGRPAFNPDGSPFQRSALFELLSQLAALARDPAFTTVAALARCPDFFTHLQLHGGPGFSVARWLKGLDELHARHLPVDLAAARAYAQELRDRPEVAVGLDRMHALRAALNGRSFAEAAAETLREIFRGRQVDLAHDDDAALERAARAWSDVVRACAAAETRFGALPSADAWDVALRLFGEQRAVEDKPPDAVEMQGWLELLWEDAPHLIVAGLNDGRIPEAVIEDPFLPESLRARLGLPTGAQRFARDAYLSAAIAASRIGAKGRVDWLVGKTSAAGDPLRPSRLLLRCADEELPARVALLFRPLPPAESPPSWTRAWKLAPRREPPPERVAVTALRSYLLCPFRFYLRHVLRAESIDPFKSELDVFDFGTLCHAALEQIGRDPDLRDATDPELLRTGLLRHLDAAVARRFGRTLSLPLLVQIESARQRLGRFAELQAAERAAGWVIIETERPFEITVAGLVVRGKIDRIERHESTGAIRVLDYKTSDRPVTPADAHLRSMRPGETIPEWARLDLLGRPRAWFDLQLPVYLRAVGAEYPGRVGCGYINLPKAIAETSFALWHDYSPELQDAAMRCAEGACAAIRAAQFWPPNESIRAEQDECAALFHHGVADSIAWTPAGEAPR